MRRSLLLALLALLLVGGTAACGGAEDETASPDEVMTEPGDTGGTTTDDEGTETEGETTTGGGGETTTGGGEGGEGDAAAGKQVFASAGCDDCHTLADAGAEGNIGPNLDETEPDFDLVVDRVTNGQGAMPSFEEDLSEDDINNVAAYVSESAGA